MHSSKAQQWSWLPQPYAPGPDARCPAQLYARQPCSLFVLTQEAGRTIHTRLAVNLTRTTRDGCWSPRAPHTTAPTCPAGCSSGPAACPAQRLTWVVALATGPPRAPLKGHTQFWTGVLRSIEYWSVASENDHLQMRDCGQFMPIFGNPFVDRPNLCCCAVRKRTQVCSKATRLCGVGGRGSTLTRSNPAARPISSNSPAV